MKTVNFFLGAGLLMVLGCPPTQPDVPKVEQLGPSDSERLASMDRPKPGLGHYLTIFVDGVECAKSSDIKPGEVLVVRAVNASSSQPTVRFEMDKQILGNFDTAD